MKIYYFGCIERAGHFLWEPPDRSAHRDATTPWGSCPDGSLAPHENPRCEFVKNFYGCRCSQAEGIAALHYKDGWTALSFWDRSVDTRGGCNSNFLAEGAFTFEEMVELAKQYFPIIMARFKFPIVAGVSPALPETRAHRG